MPIVPPNFDGEKFTELFGQEFTIVYDQLICPALPNLTEADIANCVVNMIAYEQRNADEANAREQIKAEYQATINTLQQIEDTQAPTNAQVIAAVKFIAKTLRLLLRLLARRYT